MLQIEYGKFNILEKYNDVLLHGITLRGNDFSTANIFEIQDDLEKKFKIKQGGIFFTGQVHEKEIKIITNDMSNDITKCDGLMTNCKEKFLLAYFADCVPLLFFDPDKMVIACVHAGWKGTVKKIGAEAVKKMKELYGCDASNIIACIGPSIGPCCFEINGDVPDKFVESFGERVIYKCKGKTYADLWLANKSQLIELGVQEKNIECANVCTSCNNDKYYSYRKGDNERFSAFIMLKK